MEQLGSIAIGLLIGLPLGAWLFFKFLHTSLHLSAQARDQWAKTLYHLGSAEEVQRWRRGEFL